MGNRFQIDDDGDISEFENQQWVDSWEYSNGKHWSSLCNKLNELYDGKEELKQYKQAVNDVLKSWSQKDLTAKQLGVVLAIMEELNIDGDVE